MYFPSPLTIASTAYESWIGVLLRQHGRSKIFLDRRSQPMRRALTPLCFDIFGPLPCANHLLYCVHFMEKMRSAKAANPLKIDMNLLFYGSRGNSVLGSYAFRESIPPLIQSLAQWLSPRGVAPCFIAETGSDFFFGGSIAPLLVPRPAWKPPCSRGPFPRI